MDALLQKLGRGLKKPPRVILKRLKQEISASGERFWASSRADRLTLAKLLKITDHSSLMSLWSELSERPYCVKFDKLNPAMLDEILPGESAIVFERAEDAIQHRVNLLGSGLIELGDSIDWHKDYKSGYDWPKYYMRDIDYNNPSRPSDVKFPWEVSRLQWLIPVGQAFLLTQDERYAKAVKTVIMSWIKDNPYSYGVNWACTMEVALRILSLTYFFHVFKASESWQDPLFQEQLLKTLYLHADFTARHLEFSDVNGNHYTADAAGLVFAGLFWGRCAVAKRWHDLGWSILCKELPLQVYDDGVDFEASVPYHRLVLELFFLPALYREACQFETPLNYQNRLCRMALFVSGYSQPDGMAPFWGDADDARALPLGSQALNDHRYLIGCVANLWGERELLKSIRGPSSEFYWLFGVAAFHRLGLLEEKHFKYESCAFPDGGFYILRNASDHVFLDCGPLGLANRGGHGHNDCLSFEAVLNHEKLITDTGAYIYTGSYKDRNLFRSTAYHNTPCIDEEEINRFIRWDYLWTLHYDAKPQLLTWISNEEKTIFEGQHTGYMRLLDPVMIKRSLVLYHSTHVLEVQDDIFCEGEHDVMIPLHFAIGVKILSVTEGKSILIEKNGKKFNLKWDGPSVWSVSIEATRVSPSYGLFLSSTQVIWRAKIKGSSWIRYSMELYA